MKENRQLGMNGHGPDNSMVMFHIDFSEVKDVVYKNTIKELRVLLYHLPIKEVDE